MDFQVRQEIHHTFHRMVPQAHTAQEKVMLVCIAVILTFVIYRVQIISYNFLLLTKILLTLAIFSINVQKTETKL